MRERERKRIGGQGRGQRRLPLAGGGGRRGDAGLWARATGSAVVQAEREGREREILRERFRESVYRGEREAVEEWRWRRLREERRRKEKEKIKKNII